VESERKWNKRKVIFGVRLWQLHFQPSRSWLTAVNSGYLHQKAWVGGLHRAYMAFRFVSIHLISCTTYCKTASLIHTYITQTVSLHITIISSFSSIKTVLFRWHSEEIQRDLLIIVIHNDDTCGCGWGIVQRWHLHQAQTFSSWSSSLKNPHHCFLTYSMPSMSSNVSTGHVTYSECLRIRMWGMAWLGGCRRMM